MQIKQCDITMHLLERLKSRTLTAPNTSEYVNQQELSGVTDGNAKWYNHTGRQFGSFL